MPSINRLIAADPRPVRVLNLPFGLRDGLSSHGNASAAGQYFQTVHEKQILGGYVSRLPRRKVQLYRRFRVTRVLLDLSEGRAVSWWRRDAAMEQAHELADTLGIGYVVVDTGATSADLMEFADAAFRLTRVASDGPVRSVPHAARSAPRWRRLVPQIIDFVAKPSTAAAPRVIMPASEVQNG